MLSRFPNIRVSAGTALQMHQGNIMRLHNGTLNYGAKEHIYSVIIISRKEGNIIMLSAQQ